MHQLLGQPMRSAFDREDHEEGPGGSGPPSGGEGPPSQQEGGGGASAVRRSYR